MRKVFSVALMATLACAFGLALNANAGVTIDVVFQDGTLPTGITVDPGDPLAPGCEFGGYASGSVATGRCMDVILYSTDDIISMGATVAYSSSNGLALGSAYEWIGVVTARNLMGVPIAFCSPMGGVADTGSQLNSFDCSTPLPPVAGQQLAPGTYKIGTIVWDTSGVTPGTETIAAYINTLFDGVIALINGNIVNTTPSVVVRSHIMTIVPEPGTVSLLGLGLVGLILAGRRSRA